MAIPPRPFFPHSTNTHPSKARSSTPVLAVGRRVLINCENAGSRGVTLTDDTGTTPLATLANGTEVEVVAWQPRGAGGTRYRIRSTNGAVQGWLGAAHLRPREAPPAPVRPPAAVVAPAAAPKKKAARTRR